MLDSAWFKEIGYIAVGFSGIIAIINLVCPLVEVVEIAVAAVELVAT